MPNMIDQKKSRLDKLKSLNLEKLKKDDELYELNLMMIKNRVKEHDSRL